jgi:hypothetical protein
LKALNKSRVDYVIVGGLAAVYYGRPRTTMDLDVIVRFEPNSIERLCAALRKYGFDVLPQEMQDAAKEKTHVSVFDRKSPYRLDLKWSATLLDETSLTRKKCVKIYGEKAWIESPEDLIAGKLLFGSPQDLEDVQAVLLRQTELDLKYLKEICRKIGVEKRLTEVRRKLKEIKTAPIES